VFDTGEGSSKPPGGFSEIFSSSEDGQAAKAAAEALEAAKAAAEKVEDITEDGAYSIQDEKLRKEEDARKLAAEQKKDGIRVIIKGMQKEFEELVKKNEALPKEQQLTVDELVVDPEYIDILDNVGKDMINEVKLECEHDSEKSRVRLNKLRDEFIAVLDYELFYVKGLKNQIKVASMPTAKITPELDYLLKHVHTIMESEAAAAARGKDAQAGTRGPRSTMLEKRQNTLHQDGLLESEYNESGEKKSAFEIRKGLRIERTNRLADLEKKKPAEDADDPRDVKAIEDAAKFLGDYKIKTAEGYEVPEDQQVNAEKKRRQMILLEESIHNIKTKFNDRLINVRDLKSKVILSIDRFNARIRAIDEQLEQSEASSNLFSPEIDPNEYPEDRELFLPEDTKRFLVSAQQNGAEKANAPPKSASSVALNTPKVPHMRNSTAGIPAESLLLCRTLPILCGLYDPETDGDLPKVNDESSLSQVEKDEIDENRRKLKHERQTLIDQIDTDVAGVDEKVAALRRDRLVFSVELKSAELRLLILFKELLLLSSFENKDKMLTNKLEKCLRDKGEVVANISDCHSRLQTNSGELEVWVEKDQAIMEEFLKSVPEKNAFHDQLLKIFKKKIKRVKKKAAEDEEDDEDEDSDGDDYEDDEDDEEEEDGVDDSCPPGCDSALYESIIELREKRLDQEEVLTDFQKELDELKKANDRHIARERQIDKDLNSTEIEIKKFQTEKQIHINELLVCCPLKIGQIRLWMPEEVEGEVVDVPKEPTLLRDVVSIRDCVVLEEKALDKLKGRIDELNKEIVVDKDNFAGLHKEKRTLEKDKVVKEKEIEKQHVRCEELQMLKFGQLINITELDKISVNSEEIELKKKTEALEITNEKEVYQVHAKHRKLKEKLLDVTQVNTGKLNQIAEMNGRQFFLEKELNGNKGGMQVADDGPTMREDTEERNRLVSLVKLQAKEVDALKAEINLLRRKGGHIYAPPPPPELLGELGETEMDMGGEMGMAGASMERPSGVEVAPKMGQLE
jgi:hypothetical protein